MLKVCLMTIANWDSNDPRIKWREVVDTAAAGVVDVVITRYGKPVVAMIDYDDFLALQEELDDLRAARPRRCGVCGILTRSIHRPARGTKSTPNSLLKENWMPTHEERRYRVQVQKTAQKVIARLPKDLLRRIAVAIDDLAVDPRPQGCKKLVGMYDHYRVPRGRLAHHLHGAR